MKLAKIPENVRCRSLPNPKPNLVGAGTFGRHGGPPARICGSAGGPDVRIAWAVPANPSYSDGSHHNALLSVESGIRLSASLTHCYQAQSLCSVTGNIAFLQVQVVSCCCTRGHADVDRSVVLRSHFFLSHNHEAPHLVGLLLLPHDSGWEEREVIPKSLDCDLIFFDFWVGYNLGRHDRATAPVSCESARHPLAVFHSQRHRIRLADAVMLCCSSNGATCFPLYPSETDLMRSQ